MNDNFSKIEIIDESRGIAALQAPMNLLGGESNFELSKLIDNLDNQSIKIFTLDLSKVVAINSSGLGSIIAANRILTSKKIKFILIQPSNKVLEILSITHLDKVFNIANDYSAL